MSDLSLSTAGVTLGTPAATGLGAPAGDTSAAAIAAATPLDPNTLAFVIPNTETTINVVLTDIPAEIRLDMLKKAVRDYITNSVNQANVRATKENADWDAYEAAFKADALQTAVPKPTEARKVPDLIGTAAAARERLYKGEVRKNGEGTGKSRETADPLTSMVTKAVVSELMQKTGPDGKKLYKMTDATSEVSKAGGGIKYLEGRIATMVAAGGDEVALRKFLDERYIKPAQMMIGLRDSKTTKDVSLLG
jgi:hypothetical protein